MRRCTQAPQAGKRAGKAHGRPRGTMSRHDAIGEIYDAAFEDGGLPRIAGILARTVRAGTATLFAGNDARLGFGLHELPPESARRYQAYYWNCLLYTSDAADE